jgi:hypothetical protein
MAEGLHLPDLPGGGGTVPVQESADGAAYQALYAGNWRHPNL